MTLQISKNGRIHPNPILRYLLLLCRKPRSLQPLALKTSYGSEKNIQKICLHIKEISRGAFIPVNYRFADRFCLLGEKMETQYWLQLS